jgi:hypothetical protein
MRHEQELKILLIIVMIIGTVIMTLIVMLKVTVIIVVIVTLPAPDRQSHPDSGLNSTHHSHNACKYLLTSD